MRGNAARRIGKGMREEGKKRNERKEREGEEEKRERKRGGEPEPTLCRKQNRMAKDSELRYER